MVLFDIIHDLYIRIQDKSALKAWDRYRVAQEEYLHLELDYNRFPLDAFERKINRDIEKFANSMEFVDKVKNELNSFISEIKKGVKERMND